MLYLLQLKCQLLYEKCLQQIEVRNRVIWFSFWFYLSAWLKIFIVATMPGNFLVPRLYWLFPRPFCSSADPLPHQESWWDLASSLLLLSLAKLKQTEWLKCPLKRSSFQLYFVYQLCYLHSLPKIGWILQSLRSREHFAELGAVFSFLFICPNTSSCHFLLWNLCLSAVWPCQVFPTLPCHWRQHADSSAIQPHWELQFLALRVQSSHTGFEIPNHGSVLSSELKSHNKFKIFVELNNPQKLTVPFSIFFLWWHSWALYSFYCTSCSITAQFTTPTLPSNWNGMRKQQGWMDTTSISSGCIKSVEATVWGI